jgi:hypothetical protein
MDEWDKKKNGAEPDGANTSGPDTGWTDGTTDIHIENGTNQTPPYAQYNPHQGPYGAGGYYQQGGSSQNQQGQQPALPV